ncbi:MAG: RND efflux system outer membrane lipoprotein NodT [Puniceicoccaceae bacterium 5H]|nr:MAG: RND efflux system outer membrane lipoprotein NodT [Puniceicoccaceae bacterium 5H]
MTAMSSDLPSYTLRYLAPLSLMLGLTACTSTGVRGIDDASVSPPAQWHNADETASASDAASLDTAALQQWWARFDDPVLDRLIGEALAHSPDLQSAVSRVAVARAQRGVERADLLPSASAGVSGRGTRTRDHLAETTTNSESWGASADASWEIDLFGRQRLQLSAADANLAQTEENFRAAQVSLAAEVAVTYINLRAAETQLDVVLRNLDIQEETTQLTRWREQAGQTDSLATLQAEASLEQARASLPSLRQSIQQTRNQLAILTGRTPGSLNGLLEASKPIPEVPPQIDIGIPAETLRQRPDVRAAEYAVQSAVKLADAAQRQRLPSLSLSGSIGVDALEAGDLFDPQATVGSIVGNLTAPIFQGGRIHENIVIQNEQARQALLAYESTVLDALSEVEDALISIRTTRERLATLAKATDAAREAVDLATLQYESGEADILDVLNAQRTLLSLEEQQANTTASQASAHVQLYKALGGGWTENIPSLSAN